MKPIETLEPEFRKQIGQLLADLQAITALVWVVTSGRRTLAEQGHLYELGRTQPGKVVTKAQPGSSPHNFGLAADLAPIHPSTGEIWWDAPDRKWQLMADHAHELGLVAGYWFKSFFDAPHVESADWRQARDEWKAGRLEVA